jgi:transitional endoplasmic reticulum ATPase
MFSQPSMPPGDDHSFWNDLVLPAETLLFLKKLVAATREPQAPEHSDFLRGHGRILLYGPPGTGKTLIARALAQEIGINFIAACVADFVAAYIGQPQAKVHDLFERARLRAPCFLFIDEIDVVCARRTIQDDALARERVIGMLTELQGIPSGELFPIVLAETNEIERVDAAILSRFDTKIELPYPDVRARRQILRNLLSSKQVDFDADAVSDELAKLTGTVSGRDLRLLVERASQVAMERAIDPNSMDRIILTRQDLLGRLPSRPAAAQPTVVTPAPAASSTQDVFRDDCWRTMALSKDAEESLKSLVRLLHNFEDPSLQQLIPKGILLSGPPGVDKAGVARAIAGASNFHFLAFNLSDGQSNAIGQAAGKVHNLFQRARGLSPCILFVGEFDGFAPKRGLPKANSSTQEIISQWLVEQDRLRQEFSEKGFVFVVAATDYVADIDSAVANRLRRIESSNSAPANS